jgi:hypothetical protein
MLKQLEAQVNQDTLHIKHNKTKQVCVNISVMFRRLKPSL